jgi:hypothetical protein
MQNTPGRRGLSRLLHRSVADYLTRHAPCRVLALPGSGMEVGELPAEAQA